MIGERYGLSRPLGSGGMGEVWEVLDARLDREVGGRPLCPASKADDGPTMITRCKREAQLTARMNHRGVPVVHDTGAAGQQEHRARAVSRGRRHAAERAHGPTADPRADAGARDRPAAAVLRQRRLGKLHPWSR
ncbi:hypothetical protein [Kibdelosporangium phytohabitans]|uniref:hypothetical protein n=1 Tax=Kibdelosporangium phytohabitans TaxID=860235 RepID=UPI001789D809|nr:hypothetical protein [Kibdelosporangium phytohabitans]MBE1467946.1 hypothetical protein [Kibdelosporangium phytohabitans]